MFRFGNQATLNSSQALVIPIGPLSLKIAIVPGGTPFLLSNTLMRALHASINCRSQELHSPMFASPVKLQLSSRGLFLININELTQACQPANPQKVMSTLPQETFVSDDVEKKSPTEPVQVTNHENFSIANIKSTVKFFSEPTSQGISNQSVNAATCQTNAKTDAGAPALNIDVQSHQQDSTHVSEVHAKTYIFESDQVQAQDSTDLSARNRSDQESNVIAPRSPACHADTHRGGGSGPEPPHTGGVVSREDFLRSETPRKDVCRSMEGPGVGEFHHQPLRQQHEDGAPEVPEIRGPESDSAREPPDANPSSAGRQCAQAGQCQSQQPRHGSSGQAKGSRGSLQSSSPPRHGGGRVVHGIRWGTRDVHLSDYDLRWEPRGGSHASATPQHGDSPHPGDPPPGDAAGYECTTNDIAGDLRHGLNEDWESDVFTVMSSETVKLKNLIMKFEKELWSTSQQVRAMGKPITLIEVFCTEGSPLTHQVNQLGHAAQRFGYSEADLSTSEGRARLFSSLIRHRPKHVWVSPDCGPWSSWTRLNESKSLENQQEYAAKREQLLYQLALCIVLFRHQVQMNQDFHWEQPAKSLMLSHPGLTEVHAYTKACQFDMCRAGDLRCPLNGMFMRKGMVVLTTHEGLYHRLHGLTCSRQHEHQPIEGTTRTKAGALLRTEYTARYPRKFARMVAKVMTVHHSSRSRSAQPLREAAQYAEDTVLAGTHRIRKPASFARSEVISPEARNETETKRRRLTGKQNESQPLQMYQVTMSAIGQLLPRVGKHEITNSQIIHQLQELFPDKHIARVIACRGTDRTMGPPENLDPREAPFRKSFMIHRSSGDIKFERDWERWIHLPKRQLVRPSHACRINVTMFARDFETVRSSEPASGSHELPTFSQPGSDNQVPNSADSQPELDTMRDQRDPNQTISSEQVPPNQSISSEQSPPNQITSHDMTSPNTPEIQSHQQDFRFKGLPKWEQQQIINMHKNLGHPSNDRLSKALQVAGFRTEMVPNRNGPSSSRAEMCGMCGLLTSEAPESRDFEATLGFQP